VLTGEEEKGADSKKDEKHSIKKNENQYRIKRNGHPVHHIE